MSLSLNMRRSWRWSRAGQVGFSALAALLLAGCSLDSLLKSDQLPPGVTDPAVTQTPAGAVAAYHGTLARFRAAFGGADLFAGMTGLLSDELVTTTNGDAVDRRLLPEGTQSEVRGDSYGALQQVRGQAGQAIGLLTTYVPEQPALRGHAYALAGYAEVFLAELFCSGIPLSTLDYGGDFTYRPGSSTADVFTHARALFDTALTLAGDSARIIHLAAVGKARALLALGDYTEAATAVAAVPDDYRYTVDVSFAYVSLTTSSSLSYSVADREGTNGLDYRTSGDPRTAVLDIGEYEVGPPGAEVTYTLYHPSKYGTDSMTPMVVASGVEARLIEAEAALQAGDAPTWLAKLNGLRQTAISPALPDTTDPGTPEGRVDLLFRERAFWLFLTGHRQGDLRRLIRQYGRTQEQVYPVGSFAAASFFGDNYDEDVTLPIPLAEQTSNPLFTGCFSREA